MGNNVFSTNHSFAASSCGAAALPQPIFDFGFLASALHLVNSCGVRVHFNLAGEAATTAMGWLSTGEVRLLDGLRTCGLGLTTTSTSTGANAQPLVSVTAYGP